MAELDREWAEGLSQADFEREFEKRFINTDSIPIVQKYLAYERPESRLIEKLLNEEDMEIEDKPELPEREKVISCCGCGRVFTANIGKFSHERRCADALKMR